MNGGRNVNRLLVEMHVLQNFAPSNLNRDDTGAPKDAIFGGSRRARISSQCQKRSVREYFREKAEDGVIAVDDIAIRTKRLHAMLRASLEALGRNLEEADNKVKTALSWINLTLDEKHDNKSEYLLFVSPREVTDIAKVINDNWDAIQATELGGDEKKAKKKDAAKASDPKVAEALRKAFDGGRAIDLALFGRMLADMPEKNADASCQVAHAISTHAVEREFDFYTAIDDLKPDDTSGADMMGTVEFNSACFYRYAVLDWGKFLDNLQGDVELARKGARLFLESFVMAEPSGKQNSFAAHNPPEFVMVSLVSGGQPINLLNAYEKPVYSRKGITTASVDALSEKIKVLKGAYSRISDDYILNLTSSNVDDLGNKMNTLKDLLDKIASQLA